MQRKHFPLMMVVLGSLLIIATGIWLATAQPVSAQCGSAASSCKNCHEVQAQLPVNSDGTAWHQSHAFGDFCYICHAGNNQATDKAEAHASMVAPLFDIQASCQQCHVNDLEARAQVYASILGVEIGSGATIGGGGETTPVDGAGGSAEQPAAALTTTELDVDDPNLVNYVQRYNEIVLGQRPVNWGNVILLVMIGMLAIGGGAFVVANEKLVKVTFGETKKVEGEYPGDVVDMLPALAGLKPQTRQSLKNILNNPGKAGKVLGLIEAVVTDKNEE